MRILILLAVASCTLFAQYSDFTVTDDGRLFFTTQLSMGEQDGRTKIFRVTADGISLYAVGNDKFDPIGPEAIQPFVSGDGSITGYGVRYQCNPRCGAFVLPRTNYVFDGIAGLVSAQYDVMRISRNARFLLTTSYDVRTRLIDLPSQATREFTPYLRMPGDQAVSNSGDVLLVTLPDEEQLLFVPHGESPRPIPGTRNTLGAILSPNGDRVVYERNTATRYELVLTDPQGSTHRVLASVALDLVAPWPNFRFRYQPSFANDGTLLYLLPDEAANTAQPMILASGSEPRPLLTIEGGVQRAILSGNAAIVWLTTNSGQLLRVRTIDAGVDEFIPETAQLSPGTLSAVPGSVIRVFGSGLSDRTQFSIGGTTLTPWELKGQRGAVQIPWEFPAKVGQQQMVVQSPGSPFHQLSAFFPMDLPWVSFERGDSPFDLTLQAAHQDFRGVIGAPDPVRPGETIHIFARNMGPVDQPVASGQRSPASPPARITTPLACTLQETGDGNPAPRSSQLEVPFAGLAGGLIGVYQIDVTIPADWRSPKAFLQCRIGDRGDGADIAVAPTSPTP